MELEHSLQPPIHALQQTLIVLPLADLPTESYTNFAGPDPLVEQ